MIDRIYVQKENNEYINETAYSVAYGCRLLGIECIAYSSKEIDYLELTKTTLVHGWVSMVRKALSRLNIVEPHLDGAPPQEIQHLFGRKMWPTTLGEIRKNNQLLFIKPLSRHKAFNGHVVSTAFSSLIKTASFDDDFEILASEVVNFVSEYRLFVHNWMIEGCRHYLGDFTKNIDFDVAYKIISEFKTQPRAWSLDMGVTSDGRTLPVEINDFFSLGSYGLPSVQYVQMLIDRWNEIVGF